MGEKQRSHVTTQSMTRPKLSICIPTYNRSSYLEKTLAGLVSIETFPFDCEIIVSDNCSSDDTADVVRIFMEKCSRIRYRRQARNVCAEDNWNSALRMATGDYALYLADDDMLIPEAVASIVRYMEQNQHVIACYAPWDTWDDAAKVSLGLGYSVEKEVVFGKSESIALFNFIIHNQVFPEIAVYRPTALHKILYRPHKAYFAFVYLAKLLDCGDVAFMPYPFYRFVTVHWAGETREHYGHKQAMRDWELFRGGVEYLLYKAFRNLGHATIPVEQRDAAQKMIGEFIRTRLYVALRLLVAEKKDFISAHELFLRLLAGGGIPENEAADFRLFLTQRAAAQSLVETFDAVSGLECIVLYRVSDSSVVEALLKEVRDGLPVRQLSDGEMYGLQDKGRRLVLVGNNMERERLLKAGYPGGLVVVEHDLVSQFES